MHTRAYEIIIAAIGCSNSLVIACWTNKGEGTLRQRLHKYGDILFNNVSY